jgi:hypothetical protein
VPLPVVVVALGNGLSRGAPGRLEIVSRPLRQLGKGGVELSVTFMVRFNAVSNVPLPPVDVMEIEHPATRIEPKVVWVTWNAPDGGVTLTGMVAWNGNDPTPAIVIVGATAMFQFCVCAQTSAAPLKVRTINARAAKSKRAVGESDCRALLILRQKYPFLRQKYPWRVWLALPAIGTRHSQSNTDPGAPIRVLLKMP